MASVNMDNTSNIKHHTLEQPKLSFIVPVYNVAPYLRKCVNSLLAQDYSDYEIILVDDGSTDNSGAICDEYASPSFVNSLTRSVVIKVLHQPNAGLSAARNSGIKAAIGEYICFVDSDDYWEPNVLGGLMIQTERENLDVLRFDYQNVNESSEIFNPNKSPRYIDSKGEVVDGQTYLNTRMGYACYAVMYIIKRDLIIRHQTSYIIHNTSEKDNCLFTPGIHFEDVEWLPRMMLCSKRVSSTTTIVYNYLLRQGSITKAQGDKTKILKNIEDRLLIIDKYRQYIEQYPQCRWLKNMQSSMAEGVLTSIMREFYNDRKVYIARLQSMNVFPLSIADQGKTYKRRALLINLLGANLYCILMHKR